MFSYIFDGSGEGGGIPRIIMNEASEPFFISRLKVIPIVVMHGSLPILAYRFGPAAYVTDCSAIPPDSMKKLEGLDLLILGALRYKPHDTHFNIEEALEVVDALKPKKTVLTHMNHDIDYEKTSRELPETVFLGYDGMALEVGN